MQTSTSTSTSSTPCSHIAAAVMEAESRRSSRQPFRATVGTAKTQRAPVAISRGCIDTQNCRQKLQQSDFQCALKAKRKERCLHKDDKG